MNRNLMFLIGFWGEGGGGGLTSSLPLKRKKNLKKIYLDLCHVNAGIMILLLLSQAYFSSYLHSIYND